MIRGTIEIGLICCTYHLMIGYSILTHTHVFVVWAYVYANMYIYICIYIYVYIYMCIHIYICMHYRYIHMLGGHAQTWAP